MSKFILTTSKEKTKRSVEFSSKYGYSLSGTYEDNKVAYACYHKLAVTNENYIKIGEDFVSVTGTVIYKDSIGKESLKKIYDDFDGDINLIRDNIIGNGAFIIKKGNEVTVFNDYLSLYYIYYTVYDGDLIISNDLFDVCNLCEGLEADYDNLILRAFIYGVYGGESEIKNVKYLQDCEKITINSLTGEYEIQSVDVDWRCHEQMQYEEVVARIGDYFKSAASSLIKHFGNPALSSTGGLDNRLNLASFLAANGKPDLYYGIGNSSMTNTFDEDLKINRKFSDKYGLDLNIVSWKNGTPINRDWDYYKNIYGFHSVHYSASRDFNENYRNISNKLIMMGCFGEIFRIDDNSYLDDVNYADVTLDQYIDLYPIGHYWEKEQLLFKNKGRIHNHLRSKLLPLCKKWDIDPEKIRANDDIFLWLERMHRSDNFMLNLMNRHHYCVFLNAQYPVVKLLTSIPPVKKSKAKFQLDLIKYLCPSILEIPIFSRCMIQTYNENTNTIQPTLYLKVKAHIKKLLPNVIVNAVKALIISEKKKSEDETDRISVPVIREVMEGHGIKDGVDCTVAYRNRLSRPLVIFAQYLYLFDSLGISLRIPHEDK